MKKILLLCAALIAAIFFTGCGGDKPTSDAKIKVVAANFPEFAPEKGGEFLGGRRAASEPWRERKFFGGIGNSLGMLGVGIEEMTK